MKEYTEKIEHFFSKHKHRWFDLFNGTDTYREQSERALLSPIKESIFSLLETVRIYENDLPGIMAEKVRERIESLEKAIEETAKRLDTSNDPVSQKEFEVNAGENKELRLFERDGKKLYFKEVRLNKSERDFGYCLATKLPEIEFWKWYLSEHFEQSEADKAGPAIGEPGSQPAANTPINRKETPAKKREYARTLRTTWYYWYLYWKGYDTPLNGKDTIDSGLKQIAEKNEMSFPNTRNSWYKIEEPTFRHAKKNINHLENVITKLNGFPDALEYAMDDLKLAKSKKPKD